MKKYMMGILMVFMVVSLALTGCAGKKVQASNAGCAPVVAAATPAKAAPVVAAPAAVVQKETIYFDFDKYNIKASEQPKITKIAGWMKDPKANALVIGYTDPIGTDKYNMGLSERRARSTKDALVKAGVPANKIVLEARGETNLVKIAKGIEANAPNRRAEVEVTVK
jgi:outer membrane protein OmpA-like peptidoglycan-associated protein